MNSTGFRCVLEAMLQPGDNLSTDRTSITVAE